uniref:Uncharacterized protein n=1 Tax=Salix viminalis TaxID=40686 RepID=A0A6N2M0Q0_SALVM
MGLVRLQRKLIINRERGKRRSYPTYHTNRNKPTSSEREARFSSRNLARQRARQSGVPAPALLLPPLPLLSPYTDTYIPARWNRLFFLLIIFR